MSSKSHHQRFFFTICPYLDSYFFKKIWVMPKHIWTPELYMFWVCNELKAKFHHSRFHHTHFMGNLGRHEKGNAGVVLYHFALVIMQEFSPC